MIPPAKQSFAGTSPIDLRTTLRQVTQAAGDYGDQLASLARTFADEISRAFSSGVAAQPEAQLTLPVHDLFVKVATATGMGELTMLREAQLDGVVPDFAALHGGRPCGWVELKAPGHTLEGARWRGREARQWQLLAELDSLIVTDGRAAVLYKLGEQVAAAALPADDPEAWDPAGFVDLLRLFVTMRPTTISRVSQLSDRLAPLARMLRDRIYAGLQTATHREPVARAKEAWTAHVHEGASDKTFASDLAQVIAYSLAIASLRGTADRNGDGYITLTEARDSLRGPNDMLAAALGPALEVAGLSLELRAEVGAIERLASAVDATRVAASRDSRGEPWLWFYEDFLAKYDPEARKAAGVYYTPTQVVSSQVRMIDQILTGVFGKPLSFGDPGVVTLDPATGSGTYPLTVIDQAARVAVQQRGVAGPRQVSRSLAQNLIAFELMPGPYAVAHLRIGQRLAEMAETLTPPEHVRVYLTDTLDDPAGDVPTLGLWGDVAILAAERERASRVKSEQPVTVVLGNPPYARRNAKSGGGWVVHPSSGRSLFADVIEPAQQAGVIFSAQRSLYDDYVYFWRWAFWKAFEADTKRPAIVSFITSSNWLRGPAFVGLRQLARKHADEVIVVDLGGGNRGSVKDENVFAIQTPVAIVTLYRTGRTSPEPARVYYRRVDGQAQEKLDALDDMTIPSIDPAGWTELDVEFDGQLVPPSGDQTWNAMPALTDLFPWQQPGVNFGRSWATSPSSATLDARWAELMRRPDADSRSEAFVTASTGRNIHTQVGGLPRLSELPVGSPHRGLRRLAFRSFDRQWTFDDPRVALLERPSLWNSVSERQIFFVTMPTNPLGKGQALVVTAQVPDFHYFANRGGKDVLPLYRDKAAAYPNVTAGLTAKLTQHLGREILPEDLAAYVFALLSHPGYQSTFEAPLETPGPRVPMTSDRALFDRGVDLGKYLIWLQTYAERFREPSAGRGDRVPLVPGLSWSAAVTTIPEDMASISYEASSRRLHVSDGVVTGLNSEIWDYTVSGMPVVRRWLGSRTAKGVGRASSPTRATPLDRIRPTTWEDAWNDELLDVLRVLTITVDHRQAQQEFLEEVLDGPLIPAGDLPSPSAAERKVPRTVD